MNYRLKMSDKARRDFLFLDREIQKRIAEKLRFYLAQDNPLKHARKLKDIKLGAYRFRIGEYRAIFDIDNKGNITILLILRIKHRREAYM